MLLTLLQQSQSAVTGSLATTESGSDSAALTGKLLVSGSLAVNETGSDSAAVNGKVLVNGSLAVQETGNDSSAITGQVVVSGALSATDAGTDTGALTGKVVVAGSIGATETGSDTALFSNETLPLSGSIDATETGTDAASLSGAVLLSGSISATETQNDTLDVSGSVRISGYVVATDSEDALAGTGKVLIQGIAGISESAQDSAAIFGSSLPTINGSLQASESGSDTAVFRPPEQKKKAGGGRHIGFIPAREVTVSLPVTPRVYARSTGVSVVRTSLQSSIQIVKTPMVRSGHRKGSVKTTWTVRAIASQCGARGSTRSPSLFCTETAVAIISVVNGRKRPSLPKPDGEIVLAGLHGARHGTAKPNVKTVINPTDDELAMLAVMMSKRRQARVLNLRK